MLSSGAVSLSSAVDSVLIDCRVDAKGPQGLVIPGQGILRLGFDLVDAETKQRISSIGADRPITQDTVQSVRIRHRLAGLTGRTVFVRPVMKGILTSGKGLMHTLVHVHLVETEEENRVSFVILNVRQGSSRPCARHARGRLSFGSMERGGSLKRRVLCTLHGRGCGGCREVEQGEQVAAREVVLLVGVCPAALTSHRWRDDEALQKGQLAVERFSLRVNTRRVVDQNRSLWAKKATLECRSTLFLHSLGPPEQAEMLE
jgi:hypothetical protein